MTSPDRLITAPTLQTLAIALGVFVVYAAGACPTIYVGDSGELVTAVDVLGIPHPTGYPLYVLLGKLWTITFPFGSVAWRMSLFSALAAAAACGLLYRLARSAGLGTLASTTAALTLGFSPSFWSQANVQRVYSLGAVFVVLVTIVVFRWQAHRRLRSLCLAFFLCGLGATNHTYMALYAVALGIYAVALERGRLLRPRPVILLGAAGLFGLLPYVYLPLRSAQNPPLDWGNPETLESFLNVVLRRDFWDRAWVQSPADLARVLWDYVGSFPAELTWVGATLAILGVASAWRRGWPVAFLVAVMAANAAALAAHGSVADIFIWHRYYIPSYVIAALLIGAGADWSLRRLPRGPRWLVLLLPLFLLVSGWRSHDRSRYEIADAYARMVLQSIPPGAHLAASDDNILFSLIYLIMVEKQRPDVDLILQGVGAAELRPLHFDAESERLFFTHHPNWTLAGLEVVPRGLVFEVRRTGTPLPDPVIESESLPGEDDDTVPKDYLTQNLIGDFHYMLGFTLIGQDRARALRHLERAAASAPRNGVLFYNLGLLYGRAGLLDEALAAFERAHELDPRRSVADRLAELKALRTERSGGNAERD